MQSDIVQNNGLDMRIELAKTDPAFLGQFGVPQFTLGFCLPVVIELVALAATVDGPVIKICLVASVAAAVRD